jgi:mannose-6-phosphate isomerase-like protein (cupin superfamily)
MKTKSVKFFGAVVFSAGCVLSSLAQTPGGCAPSPQRKPSTATRPVVVLTGQSLADVEHRLHPDNKVEELYGGAGVELRVAVQHEKDKPAGMAEVHDASDDIYYVLEGTATLTVGGALDTPKEVDPGEWRGAKIVGGKEFKIAKGDLIVVPRGTPHVRSTTGQDFSMILIKVYTGGMPAPKPPPPAPAKP